jgi:uncharacterized heparinase superfamily protein
LIEQGRVSIVYRRRLSSLVVRRLTRNLVARAATAPAAAARAWPGRVDRLIIAPQDLRTADTTRATEIYAGRFVFAGKVVTCHGRPVFDLEPPSEDWEAALLGFGWLRHLRAADTAIARANARALLEDWLATSGRKTGAAHRIDVLARRVVSLLAHAPLVLGEADSRFYRRYVRHLTRDVQRLRAAAASGPDGVPRLQAAIALCYGVLCLANQGRAIRSATRRLCDELQRQILPDGGHISRNPGALVDLLADLLPLRQAFTARNLAPPQALLNAIDRMMPMLRFFRHGDGSFALFNGMSSVPSDLVATLLAYDDSQGLPLASMPHCGFQRLEAGAMAVIVDTGPPPPPSVSHEAHAGCLSFELSSGVSRIVVNCGMPASGRESWRSFARTTPAHSTLVWHEASSCEFVERSAVKRLLRGAPILGGPTEVEAARETTDEGVLLALSHDGYAGRFGIVHRRVLMAASDGHRLDGEDTLTRIGRSRGRNAADDYAIRFHLHPTVKASRLNDARGVMLMLPNREVWIFEAAEDRVDLEDSVFLAATDGPRRTTQIVIRQHLRDAESVRWSFVRSPAPPSVTAARRQARREPELPL